MIYSKDDVKRMLEQIQAKVDKHSDWDNGRIMVLKAVVIDAIAAVEKKL